MSTFIEEVVGDTGDKKRWREYERRAKALPVGDQETVDTLVSLLEPADVDERAASDGTPVRGVVGDDRARFADELLARYSDGAWIDEERERPVDAIHRAQAENRSGRS